MIKKLIFSLFFGLQTFTILTEGKVNQRYYEVLNAAHKGDSDAINALYSIFDHIAQLVTNTSGRTDYANKRYTAQDIQIILPWANARLCIIEAHLNQNAIKECKKEFIRHLHSFKLEQQGEAFAEHASSIFDPKENIMDRIVKEYDELKKDKN